MRARGAAVALALAIAGCTPARMLDAVIPKEGGVRLVARDAAYGADKRQRIDVYAPVANAKTPAPAGGRPMVVFFYGGSWMSGTKGGYGFVAHALAARGYVVAVPDYRLVPKVRFPAFLEDNAAAVRWLRTQAGRIGGDPDRIVLIGHSAGAYDAAMLALDPRWLGADRRVIRGWIGLAGPYDFLPLVDADTRAAFGDVADAATTQPVSFASADDPPALLGTGDRDKEVAPRESDVLAARLTAAGVAVERRRYPRVGHGLVATIAKPLRGRAPLLADMVGFIRRVTG